MDGETHWTINFYEDEDGGIPVATWLDSLSPAARAAVLACLEHIVRPRGLDVCRTDFGKQLGDGLFELRIRQDAATIANRAGVEVSGEPQPTERLLLRVFCHAYGKRVILLLGAYDKLGDTSTRRQSREIKLAKQRLRSFKLAERRRDKGEP